MTSSRQTRRHVLAAAGWGAAAVWTGRSLRAAEFRNANDRPRIAVVGCGSRWDQRATLRNGPYGLGKEFPKYGDIVAVCDVDKNRVEKARDLVAGWMKTPPEAYGDYRAVIDRDDIDLVHIVTPDHWHAKILIEAMLSGKDAYCEKPMTLTIDEGRRVCEVCTRTGQVVQIGTQQRSQKQMQTAVALIRAGRLGTLKKVQCAIGGAPTSPEIPAAAVPEQLDWNQWLGPAPETAYRFLAGARNEVKGWTRSHYEFRWWYDYSGGKLTDWGAHHVDIATWGMGKTETGPIKVDPVMVEHPVPFLDGLPQRDDCYNTATKFRIVATYADGVELTIRHDTDNGILFEGTDGRIFVNRGRLTGAPVEELKTNPLPDNALAEVYKGETPVDHVQNFFNSVVSRKQPVSDVFSHHRALSTCHLAGIAARLNRPITWDPQSETIVEDPLAQSFVARTNRKGFEIQL